jgi:hypothetical protein
MPIGMPSIGESGFPDFQHAVLASAASRAPVSFTTTQARTTGSRAAMVSRQRSR